MKKKIEADPFLESASWRCYTANGGLSLDDAAHGIALLQEDAEGVCARGQL